MLENGTPKIWRKLKKNSMVFCYIKYSVCMQKCIRKITKCVYICINASIYTCVCVYVYAKDENNYFINYIYMTI